MVVPVQHRTGYSILQSLFLIIINVIHNMSSKDTCTGSIVSQGGAVESLETQTLNPQKERKHPWNSGAQGTTVGGPFSRKVGWIKWEMYNSGVWSVISELN